MMEAGSAKTLLVLLILLAAAWHDPARGAQVYTWTDADGTIHFSDLPRQSGPMDVLEVDEVHRPGTGDAGAAPEAPAAPPAAAGSGEPPQTAAQARRERMVTERAERRESQAENEQLCARHRQRLEQMEPARRVFYTNEAGEAVRMDDDQRLGLIEESKAFLAANCD